MEDKLRLNTDLYGFEGIIGRRDYFLNIVIICSIMIFFTLPYFLWTFSHTETFADMFNYNKMFLQTPILLKLWFLGGTIGTFVLTASNIWRRLNDINGKINTGLNGFIVLLFLISSISYFLLPIPYGLCVLISLICIIIKLIMLFKRGKITGNYPYDFRKEFNWGAFLGTWIWGLFNKSFKTLWMLLLGFTPWSMYFALYCGLKGNEWAYTNKKCNDVEAFNKSQEKQSTIFAVLLLIGIPVVYILLIAGLIFGLAFTMVDDVKNNPQKAEQRIEKFEDMMSKFGSLYFESHIITPDENKYYVSSSDWNTYSFKEKKDILDMAASLAATERSREHKKQYPNRYTCFSKTTELERTKIYSSETKQLLGEFHMDETSMQSGSFKDIVKAGMNAYKFYHEK